MRSREIRRQIAREAQRLAAQMVSAPVDPNVSQPAIGRERAGYDIVQAGSKKRRQATSTVQNEDHETTSQDRRRIKNTTLNQTRNFSIVSWAINQVINYNTQFGFQSSNGDEAFDKALQKYIGYRSLARQFDASGRMDLWQFCRVLYGCQLADGDAFGLKISNGAVQGIEGDRIAWPNDAKLNDTSNNLKAEDFVHGVQYGYAGKPINYIVCKRNLTMLAFERLVSAANMIPMVMYRRFDQGRGMSPLVSALATAQDLYETNEAYALKSKLVAWAGMIVKRETAEGSAFATTVKSESDDGSADRTEYDIPMEGRPWVQHMDPGDSIEIVESSTPPQEFLAHAETMIRMILIALDIPFTFFDQTRGSYTIQRDAWTQWEIASKPKREMVEGWLDNWTVWQLQRAIASGELSLPRGMELADVRWKWQHEGRPWLDPKELDIDIEAIRMGLVAAEDVIMRQGKDPADIIARNAKFYQSMKQAGLPTNAWDDAQSTEPVSAAQVEEIVNV